MVLLVPQAQIIEVKKRILDCAQKKIGSQDKSCHKVVIYLYIPHLSNNSSIAALWTHLFLNGSKGFFIIKAVVDI